MLDGSGGSTIRTGDGEPAPDLTYEVRGALTPTVERAGASYGRTSDLRLRRRLEKNTGGMTRPQLWLPLTDDPDRLVDRAHLRRRRSDSSLVFGGDEQPPLVLDLLHHLAGEANEKRYRRGLR